MKHPFFPVAVFILAMSFTKVAHAFLHYHQIRPNGAIGLLGDFKEGSDSADAKGFGGGVSFMIPFPFLARTGLSIGYDWKFEKPAFEFSSTSSVRDATLSTYAYGPRLQWFYCFYVFHATYLLKDTLKQSHTEVSSGSAGDITRTGKGWIFGVERWLWDRFALGVEYHMRRYDSFSSGAPSASSGALSPESEYNALFLTLSWTIVPDQLLRGK